MYPSFITADAMERLLAKHYPFSQMSEQTLLDVGLDRYGRFVDPQDTRRDRLSPARPPKPGFMDTIRSLLTSPARRRPVL